MSRAPHLPSDTRRVVRATGRVQKAEVRTPVGPWFQVGTVGVDGVDAELAQNPQPYSTGDTPGPPPFQNGMSNLDSSSGGLRYRWAPHGTQIDCGGGLSGVADNTVITTLVGIPAPRHPRRGTSVDVDGGVFTWELDTDNNLIYLTSVVAGGGGGGGGGGTISEITSTDGTVGISDPSGPTTDLSVIGGPGVWKTYQDDTGIPNPFVNVTIGNGTLIARWWTPAPVVADFATPPFLVFIYVALKFGSTTTVDGNIVFQEPVAVDGSSLEIDPFLLVSNVDSPDDFMLAWPTHAQAYFPGGSGRQYPGVGVTAPDATQFVTVGDDPISGTAWGIGTPAAWGEGCLLAVQRIYLGAFYGA